MYLKEYIDLLEKVYEKNKDFIFKVGFVNPHSWRGDYSELSFEMEEGVPVKKMLKEAKECVEKTFEGWKGGDFTMHEYSRVYFDKEGESHSSLFLEWFFVLQNAL